MRYLGEWLKFARITQGDLAKKLGVSGQAVSAWVTGRARIPKDALEAVRAMGYDGPDSQKDLAPEPEDAADLIDPRITPEHIAEGYQIFFEATQKAGIDLSVKDPMQVGLLIGVTSQEVARGLTEETRLMLIQRNVVLLGGARAKPL